MGSGLVWIGRLLLVSMFQNTPRLGNARGEWQAVVAGQLLHDLGPGLQHSDWPGAVLAKGLSE